MKRPRIPIPALPAPSGGAALFWAGVLLLAGLSLLWTNETRSTLATTASRSVAIDGNQPASSLEGNFVSVTGWLTSPGMLGDDPFLRAGDYVFLERRVEMYAWVKQETSTILSFNEPESRYRLAWTSTPQYASEFAVPAGHENPLLFIAPLTLMADEVYVGRYALEPARLVWPDRHTLPLNAENVIAGNYLVTPEFIYLGTGTPEAPHLGDVRISYGVVYENVLATVLGKLGNGRVHPYFAGEASLYHLLEGEREQALAQLQQEDQLWHWLFRGGGVLSVWGSLLLLVAPMRQLLTFLPLLGRLSSRVLGLLALLPALVLGINTGFLAGFVHNFWAVVLLGLMLIAAMIVAWKRWRGSK